MLCDRLDELEERIFSYWDECRQFPDIEELTIVFKAIKTAWREAAFSPTPDHSLVRYIHFQQEGIRKISDALYLLSPGGSGNIQCSINGLISHLRGYLGMYFNEDAVSPYSWHQEIVKKNISRINSVLLNLESSSISPALKGIIKSYVGEIADETKGIVFTYRSLNYFERVVDALHEICLKGPFQERQVVEVLSLLGFNHLGLFAYFKNKILDKADLVIGNQGRLDLFIREKVQLHCIPQEAGIAYDTDWPTLRHMIAGWLNQEIKAAERAGPEKMQVYNAFKLPLNISVSYLAFIIRLIHEENHANFSNLASVFKFISAHFATKRQPAISPGSLSKEYYSTDQQTAARVRDLLQKMIARINRNFFPVLAAANAITAVLAGML